MNPKLKSLLYLIAFAAMATLYHHMNASQEHPGDQDKIVKVAGEPTLRPSAGFIR